jgi:hypothetical protein
MSGLLSLLGGAAAAQVDIATDNLAAKRAKGLEEARAALEMKRAEFNQGRNDSRAERQNAYSLKRDKLNNEQADSRAQRSIDAASRLQDRRDSNVIRYDSEGLAFDGNGSPVYNKVPEESGAAEGSALAAQQEGLLGTRREQQSKTMKRDSRINVGGASMSTSDAVKIWTEEAKTQRENGDPVTPFKDWLAGMGGDAPTGSTTGAQKMARIRHNGKVITVPVEKLGDYGMNPDGSPIKAPERPAEPSNDFSKAVAEGGNQVAADGNPAAEKKNILNIPTFEEPAFSAKERELNPTKVSEKRAANLKKQIKAQADVVIPAMKSAATTLSESEFRKFFALNIKPYITKGKSFTTGKRHPAEVEYRKILDTVYSK